MMHARVCAAAIALTSGARIAYADNPAEALELQRVEVVGTTPVQGLGTALKDVPANVQIYSTKDLAASRAGNLARFLEQTPTSVSANAAQGNPYQTDISFRGFTASPLVGVPQGLSVFQDGVRINEPFGDVVNWDFVPQSAIAGIQLIPGSNPLFGLNTLGGALAIYTKSGSQSPGGAVEVSGGSFGRRTIEVEHGGSQGPWDAFLTAHTSRDDGWARHNPSRVAQFFGKVGHQTERDDLDVTLTAADNRLEGSQTLPASFLDDRRQAYTYPDINLNKLAMVALKGSHATSDDTLLSGNVYVRRTRNRNFSSNVNANFGETDPATGVADTTQATNDRADLAQTGVGGALQWTDDRVRGGQPNRLVLGLALDVGHASYVRASQPASFDASRAAVPTGAFATVTDARTRTDNRAVYATDTYALDPRWSLTASARYDIARVRIRDHSGSDAALDGDHVFRRLNPALGLTFNPTATLTTYASYNEGMRAPTATELTCADPQAPCQLPNSFLADPALRKVVAKTAELGARGTHGALRWSAALYRTDLSDDLQFVSSGGGLNAGYFQNVGTTQRRGLEMMAASPLGPLHLTVRYSRLDATYRTRFVEHSPSNTSANAQGDIVVMPGDRIPALPRQTLRMRLDTDLGDAWSLGATLAANDGSRARGDENNGDARHGAAGYAVVDLDAAWRFAPHWEATAHVDNVFDRKVANFAILGRNVFANPARTFDPGHATTEPFYGLGAPRGVWVGVRYAWD